MKMLSLPLFFRKATISISSFYQGLNPLIFVFKHVMGVHQKYLLAVGIYSAECLPAAYIFLKRTENHPVGMGPVVQNLMRFLVRTLFKFELLSTTNS